MGDGAEQVGPHLLFFVLCPQAFPLLGLGGEGAGHNGDDQKGQKGQGVAGECEIHRPVRVCKDKIDTDHAQQRGDQAKQVPGGQAGDQQHRQNKDGRGEAVTAARQPQQIAQAKGTGENDGGDQKVPPGKGKQPGGQSAFLTQRGDLLMERGGTGYAGN